MGFILVSAGDGEPFFQPRRGPAVERVPPRLKSFPPELTGVDDGSPSSAPELVLFNLVHKRKDTLNKTRTCGTMNIIHFLLRFIKLSKKIIIIQDGPERII